MMLTDRERAILANGALIGAQLREYLVAAGPDLEHATWRIFAPQVTDKLIREMALECAQEMDVLAAPKQ